MRQSCPACCTTVKITNDYKDHWTCFQCGWNGKLLKFPLPKLTGVVEDFGTSFPAQRISSGTLKDLPMRHSDTKKTFKTGAQRDSEEGKGCPSLISPVFIHRLGVLLQKGAKHYGADNWMKGMKYRRTANSIIRHMFQWLACDEEEDHLAAIAFGVMCLMHYEEDDSTGLDDRCRRLRFILPSILTTPEPEAILEPKGVGMQDCRAQCGAKTTQLSGYCTRCRSSSPWDNKK